MGGDFFKGLKAETLPTFKKELNKNNVILLDFQEMCLEARGNNQKPLEFIHKSVVKELRQCYPDIIGEDEIFLPSAMANINNATGENFIIIIDEWDYLYY